MAQAKATPGPKLFIAIPPLTVSFAQIEFTGNLTVSGYTASFMLTENNRVELKRELTDKFERSVVAFLNYPGGGEIFLGVNDDGSIAGLADVDEVQLKIVDRIKNNIRPATLGLFDVIHEQRGGKDTIRVVVSGGLQSPYYLRARGMTADGCFVRVGSSVQPMTEQMIESLLARRQTVSLQTTPSPRQRLTFRQLKIYYEEKGLTVSEEFLSNLELVGDDGIFNYAAYLLADINSVSIKVAKYAGTDKYDLAENEEYGNRCLLTATHRVLERLESENRTFAKITYPNRLEKSMVDKTALREAVINAIVHNDYHLGVPLVEIFSDRIVVTSTGGLVAGLSPKDFFNCRSMPRNRELMRVFRDVELVESLGSGMTRILRAYDRSIFELTPSFLVMTFWGEEKFEGNGTENGTDGTKVGTVEKTPPETPPETPLGTTLKTREKTPKKTVEKTRVKTVEKTPLETVEKIKDKTPKKTVEKTRVKTVEKIPPETVEKTRVKTVLKTRVKILLSIAEKPTINIVELIKATGLTRRGIEWNLKKLKENGRIRRVGPDKGGHWELVK